MVTIAILLGASVAGWIMTEIIPPDLPRQREIYSERWGERAAAMVEKLGLYDPFRSFWYTGVLAMFFAVLLLCLASRWRTFLLPSLRMPAPAEPPPGGDGRPGFEVRFDGLSAEQAGRDPLMHYARAYAVKPALGEDLAGQALQAARRVFRRRGYRIAQRREGEAVLFTAVAGRWRSLGNFVFHLGLILITAGGAIGSRFGDSKILFGGRGDTIPLRGGEGSIRVDDFQIVLGEGGRVKDYIASLAIVGPGGDVLAAKDVRVNHPLRFGRYSIYQNSYTIAEDDFASARLAVTPAGYDAAIRLNIAHGGSVQLPGTAWTLRAGRFKPDFRLIGGEPRSVSRSLNNPALEIHIEGPDGRESGWVFLLHPGVGTIFERLSRVVLEDLEPRFLTGLKVGVNPGASVLLAGMIMASAGLLALMLQHHRVVRGKIDGTGITAVGVVSRWKVSFSREIEAVARELEQAVAVMMTGGGKDGRR